MAQSNAVAVRLSVEGKEAVRAALLSLGADGEKALARLNFDTATGGGKVFNAIMEEGSGIARSYAAGLGPIGNVLATLGGGWLGAGAAAGGFGYILEQSVEKAESYERAMRGVEAVLLATGGRSGVTANQVDEMAERIATSTLNTREQVIAAAEELLTFGKVGPDAFEATLNAAADLAASPVFRGDLAAAVKAISVAAEGNFAALQRAGVVLSDSQKELIKNLNDTGEAGKAVSAVIAEVEGHLGGAAGAQDQGLTGASHKASEAWDHLLTSLGQSNSAGGAAEGLLDGLADRLERIDRVGRSHGFLAVMGILGGSLFGGPSLGQIDLLENGDNPNAGPKLEDFSVTPANTSFSDQLARLKTAGDTFIKGLDDRTTEIVGSASSRLGIFIANELERYAQQAKIPVGSIPADVENQIRAHATSLFNAQNRDQTNKSGEDAARKAQELAEAIEASINQTAVETQAEIDAATKATAQLAHDLAESVAALHAADDAKLAAQDAYQVASLQGQAGYFDALNKQLQDSTAAQLRAVDDELAKEITALEEKREKYKDSGADLSTIDTEITNAQQAAADKRVAIAQDEAAKKVDIARQEAGDLQQWIDKANEDSAQSLKSFASDTLSGIDNTVKAVLSGQQKVGDAAKSLLLDTGADLFQKAFEQNILGPIGGLLNTAIGTGKPDGSSALNALWVQIAGPGGLPGIGGSGGGGILGDLFDSIFDSGPKVGLDNTPLTQTFDPSQLLTALPGFARGGEFDIPGSGHTDSQLVAFRATPGERVSIRTPSQRNYVDPMARSAKSAALTIHIEVHNHIAANGDAQIKTMVDQSSRQAVGQAVEIARQNTLGWWEEAYARNR